MAERVTPIDAVLLGLIQGLTEFLPVSSSGHLVMTQALLGVGSKGIVFEVVVHVATLVAIVIFYRRRIAELILGALAFEPEALSYVGKLAVATLPAVMLALGAKDFLEAQFEIPAVSGVGLLVTGALLWTTRSTLQSAHIPTPGWGAAVLIGCAQAFAIVPGISRSGTTVVVALALGVAPLAAAEFSFLMGVIAIFGAAVLTLPEASTLAASELPSLLAGGAAALVSGLFALWLFVRLLRGRRFYHFAFYTWTVGAGFLAWLVWS